MQFFSHGNHGSRARAPNDDVEQHGGLTRVNREFKHDVYDRRQTAKMTSEFALFSSNP